MVVEPVVYVCPLSAGSDGLVLGVRRFVELDGLLFGASLAVVVDWVLAAEMSVESAFWSSVVHVEVVEGSDSASEGCD